MVWAGSNRSSSSQRGQDAFRPLVGRERLALLDADRLPEAEAALVERRARLLLHDLIEQLPEPIVGRRDRAEWHAGQVDELQFRLAAQTAGSAHGPWRISNSPALAIALSNDDFRRTLRLASLAGAPAA